MKIANVSINDVLTAEQSEPQNESRVQSTADVPKEKNSTLTFSEFENQLSYDIESWSAWRWQEPYRTRLGASVIGDSCERKLFFHHRWIKPNVLNGRMNRLLQRGHREEMNLTEILRGIGFYVNDRDDNGNQHGFSTHGGHYGGRCDAVVFAPERFGMPGVPILASYKTAGTGAAFTKFSDKPIKEANPLYWAQETAMGFEMGIGYALWLIVNKNDDSIQPRIEKLSTEEGSKLNEKAKRIIWAYEANGEMPKKIANKITDKNCQLCNYKTVCHDGDKAEKNCRSCSRARPMEVAAPNGRPQWYCDTHRDIIPENFIASGCEYWRDLTVEFA